MPHPLPVPVRQAIWRRDQDGQDGPTITKDLGLAPRTVRQLLRRFRRDGQAALIPSYDRCGTATPEPEESVVQAALSLRREHPTWGTGIGPHDVAPPTPERPAARRSHAATLVSPGRACPAPTGRRPVAESRRPECPHQVWQMDAAELITLRTGRRVCWLRIVDECSGAVLWTAVFLRGRWTQVPPTEDQAQLRLAFGLWRRPERYRVDNGVPWGSWGDLPTDLTLWLIGLEVGVDWNPPVRPQDNGVMERSQGKAKQWSEPWTCDSPEKLQRRLEEMDGIQRQEYPHVGGRSRLEAYPGLAHSGRAYAPE